MSNRKSLSAVVCAAMCVCGGVVNASSSDELTLSKPVYGQTEALKSPLKYGLDKIGALKTLEDNNINVGGLVELSWTYNFSDPDNGTNAGRVFDFEDQLPLINQIMIYGEKTVDASKGEFDIGGRIEFMWGSDARLIHSNGIFDWYDGVKPQQQFDLTQLYVTVATPVKGLSITAGKFVTLVGQEVINPTGNLFYSHSYLFGFAIPFTQTGILATYAVNDKLTVTAGATRGWEQSWDDNNGNAIDFLGQVKYVFDDKLSLIVNLSVGPENAGNTGDWRWLINPIVSYTVSDQLSVAGDFVYAYDELGENSWYGVAGYASYTLSDTMKLNGRLEWFNDKDGARGLGTNVYEATVGLWIKPFPKDQLGQGLTFRPELRYDYAGEDIFNDGDDQSQFTFGADLIYAF